MTTMCSSGSGRTVSLPAQAARRLVVGKAKQRRLGSSECPRARAAHATRQRAPARMRTLPPLDHSVRHGWSRWRFAAHDKGHLRPSFRWLRPWPPRRLPPPPPLAAPSAIARGGGALALKQYTMSNIITIRQIERRGTAWRASRQRTANGLSYSLKDMAKDCGWEPSACLPGGRRTRLSLAS